MDVAFYTFTKRKNSTKQPTGTGTVKACKLKDDCSVHNPVVICASNTMSYNYAHIRTWSRYYFVTDTVYLANNLVEYHLSEDYLASHKTGIGSTVAHIAFASDHYSSLMIDPRIALSTSRIPSRQSGSSWFNGDHYLLTVFNNANTGTDVAGMASVYYLTRSQMLVFKSWLGTDTVWEALQDYFQGNPLDAIFSLKWIPYEIPSGDLSTQNGINIGDQCCDYNNIPYVNNYAFIEKTAQFNHSTVYTDFRRYSPYTTGFVYLPGIGTMDLNIADFLSSDHINVKCTIEAITGSIMYSIERDGGEVVATASTNVAADVPLGRSSINASGVVNSIGGIIGGTVGAVLDLATNNIMGAGREASQAVSSAVNMIIAANQHTSSIAGGVGSRCATAIPKVMYMEYVIDTEDPTDANYIAVNGRPVNETHAIYTHSGYVQTIGASVALSASEQEIETINKMLDAGIYYE